MKRLFAALMALALILGGAQAQEDIFAATPTPTASAGNIGLSIAEYTYATTSNATLGVRFAYPSHWEMTPGRRTICYEEPVAEGYIPARMAVSVKQLDDRADEDDMDSELSTFMRAVFTQYDSYEIGNLMTDTSFMEKTGYSTIYRAYKGDQSVQGSVIMAAVGSKIYAFHFSADANDYDAMSQVMEYLRNSVQADNG